MRTTPGSHCPACPNAPFLARSQGAVRHRCPGAGPLPPSALRRRAQLALVSRRVYGKLSGEDPAAGSAGGAGQIEREGAMSWTKPAFEEIKMDAEAKSYSDGITW